MKPSPVPIVRAHYETLFDARTGKARLGDHLLFAGLPVLTLVGVFVLGAEVGSSTITGLLTVCGVLSAFLFGVMLQVAERAMDWSDAPPAQGPDTSRHATLLIQIAANAGYAALVSLAAASVFVVASFAKGTALLVLSALGLALLMHLGLVLLMVIGRVFGITEERLNDARTGHLRAVKSLPQRKTGS